MAEELKVGNPSVAEPGLLDPQALRQQQYLQTLGTRPRSQQEYLDSLTPEKRQRVLTRIANVKHGMHAVAPLTCVGPSGCPFIRSCPLVDTAPNGAVITGPEEDFPIGNQCLLEGEYMVQKLGEYLVHLDVDPSNPIELSIVQELALLDLQKNRALLVLSNGDRDGQGRDLMHVDISVTGFTQGGRDHEAEPLVSKTTKIHPVLEYIDKLERRREKWLDRLMETRKAKADWAAKMGTVKTDNRVLDEIKELKGFLTALSQSQEPLLLADTAAEALEGIGLDEEIKW